MNQMKEQPILKWIASHHDDDPTINATTLSTGMQLNIQADKFATKRFQQIHSKPKVPLDP